MPGGAYLVRSAAQDPCIPDAGAAGSRGRQAARALTAHRPDGAGGDRNEGEEKLLVCVCVCLQLHLAPSPPPSRLLGGEKSASSGSSCRRHSPTLHQSPRHPPHPSPTFPPLTPLLPPPHPHTMHPLPIPHSPISMLKMAQHSWRLQLSPR